jgi:hypothetical protein
VKEVSAAAEAVVEEGTAGATANVARAAGIAVIEAIAVKLKPTTGEKAVADVLSARIALPETKPLARKLLIRIAPRIAAHVTVIVTNRGVKAEVSLGATTAADRALSGNPVAPIQLPKQVRVTNRWRRSRLSIRCQARKHLKAAIPPANARADVGATGAVVVGAIGTTLLRLAPKMPNRQAQLASTPTCLP